MTGASYALEPLTALTVIPGPEGTSSSYSDDKSSITADWGTVKGSSGQPTCRHGGLTRRCVR
ncbi:hypothetical protein ACFQL4_04670 [Halosimplex aquaticum]